MEWVETHTHTHTQPQNTNKQTKKPKNLGPLTQGVVYFSEQLDQTTRE